MKKAIDKFVYFIENTSINKLSVLVIAITLLVFSPTFFGHQFLTFDDNWYIYENENVKNLSWNALVKIFSNPHAGQYSPIGESFNSFVYFFFGKNATAFKLFALLIHIGNAVLVLKIFDKLSNNRKLSIFIALLFAIHPVQVELVSWASAIFRIAALFMFLATYFYLAYLESGKIKNFIVVILFYILALFTKEQAVLLPLALLFCNIVKKEYLLQKRIVVENLVLGCIAILYAVFTLKGVTAKNDFTSSQFTYFEKWNLFVETILGYTTNFLFPTNLSFSYPSIGALGTDPSAWIYRSMILIVFLAIGIFFSLKIKQFLWGSLWSIGFLSIALSFSFFSIREVFMADRYMYIAIIGMAFSLFYALFWIKSKSGTYGSIIYVITGMYILLLAALCFNRVGTFKNSKTVWSDAIDVNPNNYLAANSLGYYYRTQGDPNKALKYYKQSIAANNSYYLSHSNIGKVYYDQKDYDLALLHISKALEIQPNHKKGYENRAALYLKTNKLDSLVQDLNALLVYYPNNTKYLKEKAQTYFKLKKYSKAIADATELLTSIPNDPFPSYLIGHSSLLLEDYEKANLFMDKAITLKNDNGSYYFIRSVCRFKQKRIGDALKDAVQAEKLGYKVDNAYLSALVQEAKKTK